MHFFDERVAQLIGVNESIFLQNLYYLAKKNLFDSKFDGDKIWIKISTTKIIEIQPYFSRSTIRTVVKNLIEKDLLITTQQDKNTSLNTLSYALTSKSWALMLFCESKHTRDVIRSKIQVLEPLTLSHLANHWLKLAELLSESTNPLLNLAKLWSDLANIIIDNRYLIDNRIIKKINKEVIKSLDEDYELNREIDILILENSTFERRILKTFVKVKTFKSEIIYPTIEKYGTSEALIALKKTSDEFLQHKSPVAEFYKNLRQINDF